MEFVRLPNETDEELLWRIGSKKDEIGTWDKFAKVMNELTNSDFGESTWRKRLVGMKKIVDNIPQNSSSTSNYKVVEFNHNTQQVSSNELSVKIRELEKQRKKFQTEKIEYNKWLREEARDEMIKEEIVNAIAALPPMNIPSQIKIDYSTKGYALLWGDEHYAVEFELKDIYDRVINAYSPEIFENRMWELLEYVKEIIQEKDIKVLHCFSFGDFCDGVLRVSQLMKLRYGVVEATIKYADFICHWLNELSKYVVINYQMTNGNHSELRMLGQPKGTFTEDNMGEVVAEFIKVRLKDNPNFTFVQNPTGNIFAQVACHTVLGIHGEVKNMEKALREYSAIYNVPISYLIGGHLHHSKKEDIGIDTEVINVPSIIGADPYSLSLRKISAPAAKLIEIDQLRGLTCEYTLRLLN